MWWLEGGAFLRWLGREGGALKSGSGALTKGTPESSLALFLPCEDTQRSWHWNPEEDPAGTRLCWHLISNFQPPKLWEINFCCLEATQSMVICYSNPSWLRNWAHPFWWAAAKSRQPCLTLCDPIDGSPPGSPIPGILQARTLEWAAISFYASEEHWSANVAAINITIKSQAISLPGFFCSFGRIWVNLICSFETDQVFKFCSFLCSHSYCPSLFRS